MKHFLLMLACIVFCLTSFAWADSNRIVLDEYHMDDNAIDHYHQGTAWQEAGRYSAAIQEFQIAIALKPSTLLTAAIYNNMGMTFLKVGYFDHAVASLERSVALNPNFALYYEHLALALDHAGRVPEVMNKLAVETRGNDVMQLRGLYLLGVLQWRAGHHQAARQSFARMVAEAPDLALSDAARTYLAPETASSQSQETVLK